jgi:hypothetical protein
MAMAEHDIDMALNVSNFAGQCNRPAQPAPRGPEQVRQLPDLRCGRYRSVIVPSNASAAIATVSDRVG